MSQLIVDLVNNGGGVQTLLVPQTLAASVQGSSYNASNLDVSTNAILSVGAYGANTTSVTVQIEESTTGTSNWVAIPNMIFTALTSTTSANQTYVVRGMRTNQYVRCNAITVAGTTASVALSCTIVSQGKFTSVGSTISSGTDKYPSS